MCVYPSSQCISVCVCQCVLPLPVVECLSSWTLSVQKRCLGAEPFRQSVSQSVCTLGCPACPAAVCSINPSVTYKQHWLSPHFLLVNSFPSLQARCTFSQTFTSNIFQEFIMIALLPMIPWPLLIHWRSLYLLTLLLCLKLSCCLLLALFLVILPCF